MRWLKFTAAGNTSWGLVEGDTVTTVNGDPFGEWRKTSKNHALKDVKIELPLVPRTFYCVGLNYLKHLKEAADKAGTVPNVPDRPEIGYRAQNALTLKPFWNQRYLTTAFDTGFAQDLVAGHKCAIHMAQASRTVGPN